MKKALSLILAVILCFGAMIPAFAADEIPEGYTPIYTAEDLNNIRNNLSGSYILMNDIDLSVYENWEPIRNFQGSLVGNNRTIKGLKINIEISENEKTYCGLFGSTYGATIKNIRLCNADIFAKCPENNTSTIYGGILIGFESDCVVSNCIVSGKIHSENFSLTYVGGVVGYRGGSAWSIMEYCINYADVSAVTNISASEIAVGGVLGYSLSIDKSMANYGKVSLSGENVNNGEYIYIDIGGIIGNNNYSMGLLDSFNCGDISVNFSNPSVSIGGLTGTSSNIYTSYNCGIVTVPENFSGCVGSLCGNVTSCLGLGSNPYLENSFYLTSDLYPAYASFRQPDKLSEDVYKNYFKNVHVISAEEMKQQSSFSGFDFETVWTMEEGGYPVLQNQPTLIVKETLELETGEVFALEPFESRKSTDETVATVNEDGEIVALSAGTATVTIEHAYGFYTEYTITVTEPTVTPDPEPEPEPDPEPEPEPEPECPLLWIVNLIKKILNFVVNTVKSIF